MNIQSDGQSVQTYPYHPAESPGWAFVVLFAGATVVHMVLMFPFRSWFFMPLIIGGIMEAGGYYGRVWSSHDPGNFKAYVLQMLLLLAAPPIITATVYMSLGRMIRALDAAEHAVVSPRWTTALFLLGDIIAFLSQIAGAGMQATTSASIRESGSTVIVVGLFFQLALFSFFIINILVFHIRNSREPSFLSGHPRVSSWTRRIYVLYLASIFILVRNIVRIAEYLQGFDGYVASHEVFIYIFDAALMWLAMCVFVVFHPGKMIKKANRAGKDLSAGPNLADVDTGSGEHRAGAKA